MKSVLISIKPKWCELIAAGKKTIEVRKTKPKLETPFKVYIYCTRGAPYLNWRNGICYLEPKDILGGHGPGLYKRLSGNVIGEFVCDAVIPMSVSYSNPNHHLAFREYPYTGLTDKQIMDYLGNGKEGYGWHISNLVIYDKPKPLGDFTRCNYPWDCGVCDYYDSLEMLCKKPKRPPQSWCYVEAQP